MEKSNTRVLVVDDEDMIRRHVADILRDGGYVVDEAENSGQCMELLAANRPGVVLMDIQMPGIDGMETFKRIVHENHQVETIMMSAHGTIETAVEAVKYGAHDFLQKPFSLSRLREAVRAADFKHQQALRMAADGKTMGNYIVQEEVGSGASATIYRGLHKSLGTPVALKVLHPHLTADHAFMRRFENEAKLTAHLAHPNIVRVFDYGRQDNLYYLAMEFLQGRSLNTFVKKERRLPLSVCMCVGAQVCRALEAAHERNVIHRDIKPSNIIITDTGIVKLVDFGISRWLDAPGLQLTQPHQIVGTPLYMSPEQIDGKPVSAQSDIFSLGVVLYLIATLYYPFSGENLGAVVKAITNGEFREPMRADPGIDAKANAVMVQCLQNNPVQRFASAADLRNAIEGYLLKKGVPLPENALADYFRKLPADFPRE